MVRRRTARIPRACAPATSASRRSPTITVSSGRAPVRSSARWKIAGCGLRQPTLCELTTASIASRMRPRPLSRGAQPSTSVSPTSNKTAVSGMRLVSASPMLDFEQLAFIEKWRQRAARGVVVALDGTHGDIIVTMRVGEGADRIDMRGRDATGAVRKGRLTIGDRVTVAIEYAARDLGKANGP